MLMAQEANRLKRKLLQSSLSKVSVKIKTDRIDTEHKDTGVDSHAADRIDTEHKDTGVDSHAADRIDSEHTTEFVDREASVIRKLLRIAEDKQAGAKEEELFEEVEVEIAKKEELEEEAVDTYAVHPLTGDNIWHNWQSFLPKQDGCYGACEVDAQLHAKWQKEWRVERNRRHMAAELKRRREEENEFASKKNASKKMPAKKKAAPKPPSCPPPGY